MKIFFFPETAIYLWKCLCGEKITSPLKLHCVRAYALTHDHEPPSREKCYIYRYGTQKIDLSFPHPFKCMQTEPFVRASVQCHLQNDQTDSARWIHGWLRGSGTRKSIFKNYICFVFSFWLPSLACVVWIPRPFSLLRFIFFQTTTYGPIIGIFWNRF